MNELNIETRRRSRSKTPFLRSSCDHESCDHIIDDVSHVHHNKKTTTTTTTNTTATATTALRATPIVPTIIEETVEVTSSSSSLFGGNKEASNKLMQMKTKTSDYSSDDSPENRIKTASYPIIMGTHEQQVQTNYNEIQTLKMPTANSTTTTSATITIKPRKTKVRYGLFATSTPKYYYNTNNSTKNLSDEFVRYNYYNNNNNNNKGNTEYRTTSERPEYTEITQNNFNRQKEIRNNNNTMTSSRSSSGFVGFSSDNEKSIHFASSGEHLPYLEYKAAGEYWNKTPKTDYTYSKLSPYRRELAPGVVAMPNMSRRSLLNHHQRVDYMIERQPTHETSIRKRYTYATQPQQEQQLKHQQHQQHYNLINDSGDDELDVNQFSSYRTKNYRSNYNSYPSYQPQHWKEQAWITRFITAIIDTASHAWSSILHVSSLDSGASLKGYNTSYLHGRKRIKRQKGFLDYITWPFMFVYRCISLLITSVLYFDTWLLQSSKSNNKGRKRFFLSLLILLPLLLLAGFYYYLHPTETFPPSHFQEYTFTLPNLTNLPNLPKIDLSDYFDFGQNKLDELQIRAISHYEDLKDWTNEYFLFLKTLSKNLYDEGRRFLKSEPYYERL